VRSVISHSSAAILLVLGHLLLQIIDEMLRPFLGQHFTRLVRHVRLLTQRLEFVSLRSVIIGSSIVPPLHVGFFPHLVDQL
jgi:hypothetical protein